jgi:hypothetical protein
MREDDDEFRFYVPLLRRIIILVAVITAVPVVLWTITAFVRTYAGPPKIPTFHQLAATASINAPATAVSPEGTAQLQAAMQAKLANPSMATVEARATATDARDLPIGQKGSSLADRSPDSDTNATAQDAPRTADASAMATPPVVPASVAPTSVTPTSVMARAADMFPPSPPATATDTAAPNNTGTFTAAQPAPIAMESAADVLPASAPLSGPIPLPRHRPRNIDAMVTADIRPSNVPMPRPRPDSAGAAPPAETTGASPIEFIQNLFH